MSEQLPLPTNPYLVTPDITLNTITKNGITTAWLNTIGNANDVVASDGADALVYGAAAGSGDVSAASNFTTNNSIILADTVSGSKNIKQSSIVVDGSANITGANNISSNTMTIKNDGALVLNDTSNVHALSIYPASSMVGDYSLKFPAALPATLQELRISLADTSQFEWITTYSNLLPAVSRVIYVALNGNDTTGNGSQDSPYLTLQKAITIANSISSASSPVTIIIYPGVYTENNTASLTITALGITISGTSSSSSIIKPSVGNQPLISSGVSFQINNLTLLCSIASTSSALYLFGSANNSIIQSVNIRLFNIGCNLAGTSSTYLVKSCVFRDNTTAIQAVDNKIVINNCNIQGSTSTLYANTGISLSGSANKTIILASSIANCTTGINAVSSSLCGCNGSSLTSNSTDINCLSGANYYLSGVQIGQSVSAGDKSVVCSGVGSIVEITGCQIDGKNLTSRLAEGTGFLVSLEGVLNIGTTEISNFTIGGTVGISGDTSTTVFNSYGTYFINNTSDITQAGTSTLKLNNTQASLSKITISNNTNVFMTLIDLTSGLLSIGSGSVGNNSLLQAYQGLATDPKFNYYSSIYGAQTFASFSPVESSIGNISSNNSWLNSITRSTSYTSGINLFSDTGGSVGVSSIRGWSIVKDSSDSDLDFKFQNSDSSGLSPISIYSILNLDGANNQINFPSASTQLIFSSDTNLYRFSNAVLKTDGTFAAGALTANTALYANSLKQLTSSVTTSTELSYLSGVTSAIQTQLNGKLSTTGGSLTGALTLPAGTTSSPSLIFTGSSTTGLSATSGALSLSTSGIERINLSSTGTIKFNSLNSAGVVHTDVLGNLSTSLIVNADITSGTIANSALATVSSSSNNNYIVARDSSGNFTTNMITINGTTTNSTDVATKAYVDLVASLGISIHDPALVYGASNVTISGLQTIDGVLLTNGNRVLLNGQSSAVENGLWVASSGAWTRPTDFANGSVAGAAYVLISSGTVYVGSAWLCSSTLSVIGTNNITFGQFSLPNQTSGSNVGTGSGLIYKNYSGSTLYFRSLLADTYMNITTNTNDITISTNATSANTASTLVARDSSGNFIAGTITAALDGTATGNVAKTGDSMTGALTMNVGVYPALIVNQTSNSTFGGIRFTNSSGQGFKMGINAVNDTASSYFAIFDEVNNKYNFSMYNNILNISNLYPINYSTGAPANNSGYIGGASNYFNTCYITEINGTLQTASQPNITTLGGVTSLNGITVGTGTLSGLSSVSATSLTGTLQTASQPNITTLGSVTSLNSITVGTGTLSGLSSVSATSLTGTLQTASQPNITTLGGVTSINGITIGTGTISGAVSVSATSLIGTLTTAAQTNITSVGTLTGLSVSGSIIPTTNSTLDLGSGSFRFGSIWVTSVIGTISTASQPNITTLGGVTSLNGITVGAGTLSGLSSISATSITGTLATAAQTSITSVGTLTGLTVSGNIVPNTNNTLSVGSASFYFNALYATSITGTLQTASQPNITTLGGVTSLNDITVGSGTLSGLSSLSATNIIGTIQTTNQSIITSVGALTSLGMNGNIALNDNTLFLRTSSDNNHLLKFLTTIDGPELRGNGAGILTTNSGGNATRLSWNTSGVNIPNDLGVTGLTTTGNLIIGSSGTRQKKVLQAIVAIGSSSGGTGIRNFTITFASSFASAPHVVGTILNETGSSYADTFAWTVRSVSTTNFELNVGRFDSYGAAWGQNLRFAYTATDIT